MKSLLLFLTLFSLSFGLDTLSDTTLNFSIVFPEKPVKRVKEHKDAYGTWVNNNFTAVETKTKRTSSLIIKDYTQYDQTGISSAAIVTTTASSLLQSLNLPNPKQLPLTKGEQRMGYSFETEKGEVRFYIYWAKSMLYILLMEEPKSVGVSMLDTIHNSFEIF